MGMTEPYRRAITVDEVLPELARFTYSQCDHRVVTGFAQLSNRFFRNVLALPSGAP